MKDRAELLKQQFLSNELLCQKVITVFSFLSNKTRFRILCLLNEGDFCVNDIVEIIHAGELSFISQQLKAFVLAGILTKKKKGKKVIYHLKDKDIKLFIGFLQNQYLGSNFKAKGAAS